MCVERTIILNNIQYLLDTKIIADDGITLILIVIFNLLAIL